MKLDVILDWLRAIAPEQTAYAGDPVGLLVHPGDRDVTHVAVTLDASPSVVARAVETGAQLLVCHHPLLYVPLKRVVVGDPIGESVISLIRSGVSLYAAHTNWDRAAGGINDTLASKLGLIDVEPLTESGDPQLARIGNLPDAVSVAEFADVVAAALETSDESALRYNTAFGRRLVRRIAVCGGAGTFLLPHALAAGADAFVTADVRHHEFVDANARGAVIFDAGHGATERSGMAALAARLQSQFADLTVTFIA
jgi:dinuclear metal center YbgI/SA1388 family protein